MDYTTITSNYSEILFTYRFDVFENFIYELHTDVSDSLYDRHEEHMAKVKRLEEFTYGEDILNHWKKSIYDVCQYIFMTSVGMRTFDRKGKDVISQKELTSEEKQNILSWAKVISVSANTGSFNLFKRSFSKIVDSRCVFIICSKLGFNTEGKLYSNDELVEILGISDTRLNQLFSKIREKIRSVSAPDVSRFEECFKIHEEQ